MSLERLSRLRQGIYRLAGAGFSHPSAELIGAARWTLPVLDDLGLFDYSFAPTVGEALQELAKANLADLSIAYVALFESGVAGASCPAAESAYLSNSRTGDVPELQSELRRTYARYGLDTGEISADLIDHVATQMHVMAMLCSKEAALHAADEPFGRSVSDQTELLTKHILRWIPAFASDVRSTDRHAAYAALATAVESFLAHERQIVPLLVAAANEQ
ncbi:MAG: molecular chaperone TorD family protein [Acidimicrobiia bacterium]|nr:molecular chaperone TorD family protein [Acidimicrobiia bacterium]